MNLNIEPRKPTDQGGYIRMPLEKNVQEWAAGRQWSVCDAARIVIQ